MDLGVSTPTGPKNGSDNVISSECFSPLRSQKSYKLLGSSQKKQLLQFLLLLPLWFL